MPGVWHATDGRRTAFAASAATNPLEVADLRAEPERLRPLLTATGGAARYMGDGAGTGVAGTAPRRAGARCRGGGWIGLRRNGDHTVTGISAIPLLPAWLALAAGAGRGADGLAARRAVGHPARARRRARSGLADGDCRPGWCRAGCGSHDRVISPAGKLLYMVAMRRILLLAPLALTLLPDAPALAQFSGPPPDQPRAAPRPPPALPGIAARRAPEPIPGDPNANLSPTAALFDAINRGDLPAARDAVNRGASLEERNVLGLTAVDAAVDQGRNEIMFYLLSARGATRAAQVPPDASLSPAQRTARNRASAVEAERSARAAAAALGGGRNAPRGPAPATRPRLFANDGGAARPEAGFLGFDAGRVQSGPGRRG